jgi:hypothetical protein
MMGLLLLLYATGSISLPALCLLCWCYSQVRSRKRSKRGVTPDASADHAVVPGDTTGPLPESDAVIVHV